MDIKTPTQAQYARFGEYVAASLGASLEWSGADMLADMAEGAERTLGVSVGGQDDELLAYWRRIADRLGVYYEAEADA